jgi:hypothetical protein
MRGRGRVQLGSLGTLLPRQTSRLRTAAGLGARANTGPDSAGEQTSTDQTSAERTNSDKTGWFDRSGSPDTAPNDAAATSPAANNAAASAAPWRMAAAAAPAPALTPGSGAGSGSKRAARTAAAVASRSTALRYAAWGWPVTPSTALPATADLEQVFATWSRLPDAPILAACGVAFDVIETHALAGRTALARLDRLGVDLGPVTIDSVGRIGFLVRADSAAQLSSLIDLSTNPAPGSGPSSGSGPTLIARGAHFELPRTLDQPEPFRAPATTGRFWLRPPGTPRPALPTAHVILGALALVPYHALAASPLGR